VEKNRGRKRNQSEIPKGWERSEKKGCPHLGQEKEEGNVAPCIKGFLKKTRARLLAMEKEEREDSFIPIVDTINLSNVKSKGGKKEKGRAAAGKGRLLRQGLSHESRDKNT